MPRIRLGVHPLALGALLLGSPGSSAAGSLPPEPPPTNVRPFFGVGYSVPLWFGDLDHGFGLGFGFEVEQSARVSTMFRVEWHRLEGDRPATYPVFHSPTLARTAIDWSLGARAHWRERGMVRPYTEGCLGIRLVGEESRSQLLSGDSSSGSVTEEASGLVATLRLGLSTARPRGAGLFLDAGLEFVVRNPGRYGIVPLRLGIVFP